MLNSTSALCELAPIATNQLACFVKTPNVDGLLTTAVRQTRYLAGDPDFALLGINNCFSNLRLMS